jgi:hypothetical protein
MLGFRVDPAEALEVVYKVRALEFTFSIIGSILNCSTSTLICAFFVLQEITALNATAIACPEFGIEHSIEEAPESPESMKGAGIYNPQSHAHAQ